GDRQCPVGVLNKRLLVEGDLEWGQGTVLGIDSAPDRELGDELASSWVHGRARARGRLAHDQRVAEALDRDLEAPAPRLEALARGLEVVAHRVECAGEFAELFGTRRLDPPPDSAGGKLASGVD